MTGGRSTTEEASKTAADRLTFFSDAVVAIAMTLLAIELPVPQGTTQSEILASLGHGLSEYIAFLISFLVISLHWGGHHRLFRYLADAPPRLVWWSTVWLLTIVVTPFATRVLTGGGEGEDHGSFPIRFGMYAAVQALAGIAFLVMVRVIGKADLLDESAPPTILENSYIRTGAMAATFLVSMPLAWVLGSWAYVLWFAMWPVTRVAFAVHRRRHPRPTTP